MVWEEATLVVERENQQAASNTALMQMVVASVLSKDAAKSLQKVLKELTDG